MTNKCRYMASKFLTKYFEYRMGEDPHVSPNSTGCTREVSAA